MKNHRSLRVLLASLSLVILGVGSTLMLGGCKQSAGERCQVAADCESGLACNLAKDPPTCQAEGTDTPIDVLPPLDGPPADAPPDAPPDAP